VTGARIDAPRRACYLCGVAGLPDTEADPEEGLP
jgi:hypothetical protein